MINGSSAKLGRLQVTGTVTLIYLMAFAVLRINCFLDVPEADGDDSFGYAQDMFYRQ